MFKKAEERLLNPVLCDNLEVWDGVGDRRGSSGGRDTQRPVAD